MIGRSTESTRSRVTARPAAGRQELGRLGEAAAAALLERAGFTVIARRFRLRAGEVDLIVERGDLIVFVEVKTRSGEGYGVPAAAVTEAKRRRLAQAALAFLGRTGRLDRRVRFDVVEVRARSGRIERVHHIEDAFRPAADP